MVILNTFVDPGPLIISWILHSIAYFLILRKMPLKKWTCIIPFLAEREFTKVLFPHMRSFYRPFIVGLVLMIAALYLGVEERLGWIYAIVAWVVYGIFLIRLYWRLAKAFGKGKLFALCLIIFQVLFLLILGISKAQYRPIPMKPQKEYTKVGRFIRRTALVLVSIAEIAVLILGVGYITVRTLPPEIMVDQMISEIHDKTKNIEANDQVLTREEMMGEAAASISDIEPSREKFFPDHSQDQNVAVLTYVIGSNLEDKGGYASVNIRQMMDATKKGDGLTFVVEAGGSKRWFTKGIDRSSYGRYEIKDGKLSKVEDLPGDISMSDSENLADFLKWAKKNYPADRYMLVLWDHGGGVASGYGHDDVNKKSSEANGSTMQVPELLGALEQADMKFDCIGFDACLMQDIEIASAMEPYTDYYLASEETEGGYGWYYTAPFGKLAAAPGTPTEEFAMDAMSTFDQLNTIIKDDDGKPDTESTLSLVDTTLAKPAYEQFGKLLVKADDAVRADSSAYANMAVAGTNAYNFFDKMQIDLIDYLTVLAKADYNDEIASDEEIADLVHSIQASILCRNKNSADGINGIAFAFPYQNIVYYDDTAKNLKRMSMKTERRVFNDIFSIMAVQQQKAMEDKDYAKNTMIEALQNGESPLNALLQAMGGDYTEADWYVKGFEDYDDTEALVDIPLKETPDGYQIELPEKLWNIIADCQTMVYQHTQGEASGDGVRYLGTDHIGGEDANGHPTIAMDDTWIHINGQVVCYEAEPIRETKEGDIYAGKVKARLNGEEDITLDIEWDPVKEGQEVPAEGHVVGYETQTSQILGSLLDTKKTLQLQSGDSIQFIFDTYDEEGNLMRSEPEGKKITVTKQGRLKVEDAPLDSCDISFGGVLKDVYQRVMTTEEIEMHVGD